LIDNIVQALQSIAAALSAPVSAVPKTNPYKFFAYVSAANQILGSTAAIKVTLNTEDFDTGNNFDSTTNYRFTVPAAGYYQIDATVGSTVTAGGTVVAYLYKNGSELVRQDTAGSNTTNNVSIGVHGLFKLAAGDYLELWASNTVGAGATVRGGSLGAGTTVPTFFSGYFVSNA
jgi:hypothetical protein